MKLHFFLNSFIFPFFSCVIFISPVNAQFDKKQELPQVNVDNNYINNYNKQLRRIRRVYPLALEAAKIVRELDEKLAEKDTKRQKKKITKTVHSTVKNDFLYVIKDLYIEEGVLLMKLIYRETGYTTAELISKYRGGFRSKFYDKVGKIWDQNFNIKYDPIGEDWLIEQIIVEIQNKEVKFDPTPRNMNKEEFKTSKKEYRQLKREARKFERKRKQEQE
jgi:hypothetical protein